MSSGAAFRTFVAAFMHTGAAFAAQSQRSSGIGFRSAASFLNTCTIAQTSRAPPIEQI